MGQSHKFSIKDVSDICNIPRKTLRYYDEIELVVPAFRGEFNGYRYYSKDQIVTLCIIRKLRKMGFGLKAIRSIMNGNLAKDLDTSIDAKLKELEEEIRSLEQTYCSMKEFSERIKTGASLLEDTEGFDISIETIPPTQLVYTRKTMANYANAEVSLDRWVELSNLCDELGLKNGGAYIVTYYSNPLEQFLCANTDIEFGLSVEDVGERKECYRSFGNFTAATLIHVGNYADIFQSHVRLVQWIHMNHFKIVGPVSEEFIISPLDINNNYEHVTKIIVPIEPVC